MSTRVVVTQSNYLPWRGYFELVAAADDLVLYDTVQYTKRDWRNRNRIRDERGVRWLSVPVRVSGRSRQRICDTEIAERGWWRSHLSILESTYGRFVGYESLRDDLRKLYASLDGVGMLSEVNRLTLIWLFELLGIGTRVHDAAEIPHQGGPTDRLAQIAQHLGATVYSTGPAARAYLDEARFSEAGIDIEYFDYSTLPLDPDATQPDGGELSIVDALARLGADARALVPSTRRWNAE